MTESEWLQCDAWEELLSSIPRPMSYRKLTMFSTACLRRVAFECECISRLIVTSEKYYEPMGMASPDELETAIQATRTKQAEFQPKSMEYSLLGGAISLTTEANPSNIGFRLGLNTVATVVAHFEMPNVPIEFGKFSGPSNLNWQDAWNRERRIQAHILHDVVGNPFRPLTLDPRWQSSTVLDLARTIYEDRVFERLPILADALMDAGCDNESLIQHCRSEGPHVRGCWAVDLLTGRA